MKMILTGIEREYKRYKNNKNKLFFQSLKIPVDKQNVILYVFFPISVRLCFKGEVDNE